MNTIRISDQQGGGSTIVSNRFLDRYMPSANGEFVKIYLYLLRKIQERTDAFTLSDAADVFSCTEKDVLRALRYWEKAGLVSLGYEGKTLCALTLLAEQEETADDPASAQAGGAVGAQPSPAVGSAGMRAAVEADDPASVQAGGAAGAQLSTRLPNDRVRALKQDNEEVRQLLFVAEQYLGRLLSPADMGRILYFYDELHFPADLLEYLIEYCVSLGKTSIHYVEKVGLEWHASGVMTVAAAKERASLWRKDYYLILKALGVRNRDPLPQEAEQMKKWLDTYGFSMDLIREACTRTVTNTGQPSLNYTDSILTSWKNHKVKSLADVEELDRRHKAGKKAAADSG